VRYSPGKQVSEYTINMGKTWKTSINSHGCLILSKKFENNMPYKEKQKMYHLDGTSTN
jgi:hypothetical protein